MDAAQPRGSADAAPVGQLESLRREFLQPSGAARARAYYAIPRGGWDLNELIKDLDAMRDTGMGGACYLDGYEGHAQLFGNITNFPEDDAREDDFMSPGHLRKLNQYLEEAARRDLKIVAPLRAMYFSGGPWIDQDHALKEYTLSKSYVTGGGQKRIELPMPSHRDADGIELAEHRKYYRDAFVVAWPVPSDPRRNLMHRHPPVISVSGPASGEDRAFLADGDPMSFMALHGVWLLPYGPRPAELPTETDITFEFPVAIEPASFFIKFTPDKLEPVIRGKISISDNGADFRELADFTGQVGNDRITPLPAARSRWFRVTVPPFLNRHTVEIAEIEFLARGEAPVTADRIPNFNYKAERACGTKALGTEDSDYYGSSAYNAPIGDKLDGHVIRAGDVVNLTGRLNRDGILDWEVPPGTWCVMRLGYTLSKHAYTHARKGGEGYEADPFDPEAARIQYSQVPQRILHSLSPEGRKALEGFYYESFEMGHTNWTPGFAAEFSRLAGYDIVPWLPVLADEYVNGAADTEAFLADFRDTLHSLFARNHHGVIKRLCEQDGLLWISETGGGRQSHLDDLLLQSETSMPGGEFWGGQPDIGYGRTVTENSGRGAVHGEKPWWSSDTMTKIPASVSHTYGNSPRVFLEAGTGSDFGFHRVPAYDKHVFDRAFTTGGNHVYIAIWAADKRNVHPGVHHWGWINPRNTIFRQSAAFLRYVSRCQSLLQQGRFQADVLVGMEGAMHLRERNASQARPKVYVPKGYDFDFITRELVMHDLKFEDGALVLSSGMRYRVLQIPDFVNRMSVEYMRKLEELLRAGAVIVAPKPVTGLTGLDFADGLAKHRELRDRIWAGLDGKSVTSKDYGKGRLYWGASLEEVLEAEGVRPDFSYAGKNGAAYVDHIHRRIEAEDIDFYFLANAVNQEAEITARFRGQAGKAPYLFDPLTAEVRPLRHGRTVGEDSEIALRLEAVGSAFVVFAPGDVPVAPKEPARAASTLPAPVAITGPWSVELRDMFGESFRRTFPELRSYHLSTDEKVKYFSGEASYRNTFTLPAGVLKDHRWYIDCGEVRWLAEIKVNGKTAGIVWCPPWRMEVTQYLQEGENELEIVSANPWKNRMIGESHLPPDERKVTITNFRMSIEEFKTMEVEEAGLLGPISLVPTAR